MKENIVLIQQRESLGWMCEKINKICHIAVGNYPQDTFALEQLRGVAYGLMILSETSGAKETSLLSRFDYLQTLELIEDVASMFSDRGVFGERFQHRHSLEDAYELFLQLRDRGFYPTLRHARTDRNELEVMVSAPYMYENELLVGVNRVGEMSLMNRSGLINCVLLTSCEEELLGFRIED